MAVIKKILAPTDFSRNSGQAINYACDLAKQSDARLHLLHVVRGEVGNGRHQMERLERIGAMVDARADLATETLKQVLGGQPAQVITRYAKEHDIDMVVMGTHGRSGWAHLTLGSVAERVVRNSPCPVLVLGPHDGETASLKHAAQVVADAVKEGRPENIETGRSRFYKLLVDELRIPATTAFLLLDELEDREWLKYQGDKWSVAGDVDLLSDDESFVPDFETDSPALELIKRAKRLGATDLHIDPTKTDEHVVRMRLDGQLGEYCRLQGSVAHQLINQFKILAGLDVTDPFHPKEGHVRLPREFSGLDIRMTSIPVAGGQAVALRLFDPDKISLPLDHLGFSDQVLLRVQRILRQEEGLVLVTGPTGAGKTTTVYSMMQTISNNHQNIVSIEDPVEYAVPFVRQMSVDLQHGVTMTAGLRTILRMDPDIVFVGEIRDEEAAAMVMRAASAGKYVFSTMHTRDIVSTITALRDLHMDKRSLAINLTGIINQRLVRRLCQECKQACAVTAENETTFQTVGVEVPGQLFEPVGCGACNGTGFRGRIGVFEVALFERELRAAIENEITAGGLEQKLRLNGTASLEADALTKAAAGIISFEEAIGIRWLA